MDTRERLVLGNLFSEADRAAEAIAEYQAVLAADPGNSTAWSRLGDALMGDEPDAAAASRAHERALAADPEDPWAWFLTGAFLMAWSASPRSGDHPAQSYLRQALALDPSHGRCHDALAVLALQEQNAGRYRVHKPQVARAAIDDPALASRTWQPSRRESEATLRWLDPLVPATGGDPWAHLLVARVHMQAGPLAESRAHARLALAAAPDVSALHELAGELSENAGELEAAEGSYRTAVRLSERSGVRASALHRLASLLAHTQRAPEAAALFERAARTPPRPWPDEHGYGFHALHGAPPHAVLATVPEPQEGFPAVSLARWLIDLGHLTAALELLMPAALAPRTAGAAALHLIPLLMRLGQHDHAEALVVTRLAADPTNGGLHLTRARLSYLRGAKDEAMTSYYRAYQLGS